MIEWFTIAQVVVAVAAGLLCAIMGLAGRTPNDLAMLALGIVELLLLAQVVVALVAPAVGNHPSGNLAEFWVYLITALVFPVGAAIWALVERTRWSTVVMGVGALAVAVMVWRMHQIWTVQLA